MTRREELIEKLAELEHDQWMIWSKNMARFEKGISQERLKRWESDWLPYSRLPELVKEEDRVWARKTLEILEEHFSDVRTPVVIGSLQMYGVLK